MTILFKWLPGMICRGPQGLKPASLSALGGTAEAVPFPFVEEGGAVKGTTDGCDEKSEVSGKHLSGA